MHSMSNMSEQNLVKMFLEFSYLRQTELLEHFYQSYQYSLNILGEFDTNEEQVYQNIYDYCKMVIDGVVFHNNENQLLGPYFLTYLKGYYLCHLEEQRLLFRLGHIF